MIQIFNAHIHGAMEIRVEIFVVCRVKFLDHGVFVHGHVCAAAEVNVTAGGILAAGIAASNTVGNGGADQLHFALVANVDVAAGSLADFLINIVHSQPPDFKHEWFIKQYVPT